MNRRDALKNLTMSLGYTVAAPTIFSMLNSCTAKAESWTPLFLSETEKYIITHLADIILPTSDTPGALDVNVLQFLDLMYHDIEKDTNKKLFKSGARIFAEKFEESFNYDASEGTKEHFKKLLGNYFNISTEDSEAVLKYHKRELNEIPLEKMEEYSLYKFLIPVRHYTLFGYFTSEQVGEAVLNYDPIPGVYRGCISVEEASQGKVWSL